MQLRHTILYRIWCTGTCSLKILSVKLTFFYETQLFMVWADDSGEFYIHPRGGSDLTAYVTLSYSLLHSTVNIYFQLSRFKNSLTQTKIATVTKLGLLREKMSAWSTFFGRMCECICVWAFSEIMHGASKRRRRLRLSSVIPLRRTGDDTAVLLV